MKIKKIFFIALIFGLQVQPLFADHSTSKTAKSSEQLLGEIKEYIDKNDVLKKDAGEYFDELKRIRKETEKKCLEMDKCKNDAEAHRKIDTLLVVYFQEFLKFLKQAASLQKSVSKKSLVNPSHMSQTDSRESQTESQESQMDSRGSTTKNTSKMSSESKNKENKDPSKTPTSSFKCHKEIARMQEALTPTKKPTQKFEKEQAANEKATATEVMERVLQKDSIKKTFDQEDYKKIDNILNEMIKNSKAANCEQAYDTLTGKVIENIQ